MIIDLESTKAVIKKRQNIEAKWQLQSKDPHMLRQRKAAENLTKGSIQ